MEALMSSILQREGLKDAVYGKWMQNGGLKMFSDVEGERRCSR